MNLKELREEYGMSIKEISDYFEIPYRTVQQWNSEERKCAEYILKLMHYKLENEKNK